MNPVALALPLLVLVAACGGSSTPKADVEARKAYIAAAEVICAKANADKKLLKTPAATKELSPYVSGLVAIADEAGKGINALTPPAADKAELTEKVLDPFAAKLSEGRTYANQVAAASKAGDEAALTQLTLNSPKGVSAASLSWMKDYGFKECVAVLE